MTKLMVWAAWWACGGASNPAPVAEAPAPEHPGTQYDLRQALAAAEASGDPVAYREVLDRWQGQPVRWELGYLPALCTPADCHALPFDGAKVDRAIRQGWLPRLRLSAAHVDALAARCAGHPTCVFTVEATVRNFRFTPDDYTHLTLDDVVVVDVREARAEERWGQRFDRARDFAAVRERGEALRTQGYRPTLRVLESTP